MTQELIEIKLETIDEGCAIQRDAEVRLLVRGKVTERVRAYIDKAIGADGNWYNVIKFREVEIVS